MKAEFTDIFVQIAAAAAAAGNEIMKIYSGEFKVDLKEDDTPVTAADRRAHDIIVSRVQNIEFEGHPIPVISEEGRIPPYEERKNWEAFWLIDPLDGTKEFISRNGEFTVNIALIKNGRPFLGLVYIPVKGLVYYGGKSCGSYRTAVSDTGLRSAEKLPLSTGRKPDTLIAAGSRSHRSDEFEGWVRKLAEDRGLSSVEIITAGSSLKFCLAAEGRADVYPRFGPTMEWDTAAAHAVVEGAGKRCDNLDGALMTYNKRDMKNSPFVVL